MTKWRPRQKAFTKKRKIIILTLGIASNTVIGGIGTAAFMNSPPNFHHPLKVAPEIATTTAKASSHPLRVINRVEENPEEVSVGAGAIGALTAVGLLFVAQKPPNGDPSPNNVPSPGSPPAAPPSRRRANRIQGPGGGQ